MEPPSGEQGSSPVSTQFSSVLQDTSWKYANYTPKAAVRGDVGCKPTVVRQWTAVLNQWQRVKTMGNSRMKYKIVE